jgi:hypothetical protein
MPRPRKLDHAILEAALAGLELQRDRIEAQISRVRALVRKRGPGRPAAPEPAPARRQRRPLSAAARKRIAAAQKKRWAEYKKKQAKKAGS